MISRKLCDQHTMSWNDVVPGRLLHIRLHGHNKDIDIINMYQHIHTVSRLEHRGVIWHQLSILLQSFPKSHNVILMGDANTSLQRRSQTVGLDTYAIANGRCKGPQHSDSHEFLQLLDIHEFTTLNTWTHQLGPTYRFGNQSSRIDFICCKQKYADATSRRVQYLYDFPLLSLHGAHHFPMITSLLKVWHSHQCLRQQGWTKSQRLELSQQWLHPTTSTFNLQQTINDRVEQLPLSSQPLDDVHNLLNQFPATTTRTSKPPVYKHDLTPFRRFQAHHQALCSLRSRSISCIFQAWYHVQQKDRARRQMKQTSKLARKHRLKQVYDAAVRAEEAPKSFSYVSSNS